MTITRRVLMQAFLGIIVFGAAVVPAAWALELDEAKAKGWIGERRDGYVGVIDGAPAEALALVGRINDERREVYTGVATQNGVPLPQVEALAGQKLISRAAPGQFVMDASGRWIRK